MGISRALRLKQDYHPRIGSDVVDRDCPIDCAEPYVPIDRTAYPLHSSSEAADTTCCGDVLLLAPACWGHWSHPDRPFDRCEKERSDARSPVPGDSRYPSDFRPAHQISCEILSLHL